MFQRIVPCLCNSLAGFVCIRPLEAIYSVKQPISDLLLRDHPKLVNCKCVKSTSNANYSRQLLKVGSLQIRHAVVCGSFLKNKEDIH
jgi:hypothetical protein